MRTIHFRNPKTLFGTAACLSAALLMSAMFRTDPLEPWVPICFLAVIALVAMSFGAAAGVIGSILAAVVFALVLFEPLGSLAVRNLDERANLTWMFLFGLSLSFLLDSIAPDGWSHVVEATGSLWKELRRRSSWPAMSRLDRAFLIFLALFTAFCLLVLWWALKHPFVRR